VFEHFRIESLIIAAANFLATLMVALTNVNLQALEFVMDTVQTDIADQTLTLVADADRQTTTILEAIASIAAQVALATDIQENKIIDAVTAVVVAENRASTAETSAIIVPIANQVAVIDANVSTLSTNIESGLGTSNSLLSNIVSLLSSGLQTTINNQIIIDQSIFGFVVGEIGTVVAAATAANAGIVERLTATFGGIVNVVLGELIAERAREDPQLAAIAAAILHNKDLNTGLFGKFGDGSKGGFGTDCTRLYRFGCRSARFVAALHRWRDAD